MSAAWVDFGRCSAVTYFFASIYNEATTSLGSSIISTNLPLGPRSFIPPAVRHPRTFRCEPQLMKIEGSHTRSNILSALVADSPASQVSTAEDATAKELSRIWQALLVIDTINVDQNFFDLGGDSSLAVRMFSQIEQTFGVKLPLATLYEAPTIAELAGILRGEISSSGWCPLVAIQPSGSRAPLFCIHGAGGTVLIYRDLSRRLGVDQPCYGLQAQGLDGTLPPLTTIEEMATLYVKEIRRTQPHGPYFLGGYCGGGTIAYEVAQQLQGDEEQVALLAMFDTMNWSKIPITLRSKATYACQRLVFHAASFLSLDFGNQSRFLREKIKILRSRIPVWRGMLQSRFKKDYSGAASTSLALGRVWQTNDQACWQYVPKPYRGVVTDFRPSTQYRIFNKPDLKWNRLAQGQEVIVLPVNPASMLVEPFVEHLASALRQSIDAAMLRCNAGFSKEMEGKNL
jgi:phthiocerol/phenolphthiocerol synthesis type-I polyketide synthase E